MKLIKKRINPKNKTSIKHKVRQTIDFVFGKKISSENKNVSLRIYVNLDSKNKPYIYIDRLSSIKGKTKLSDVSEVMLKIIDYAKNNNIDLITTNTWIFVKYPLFAKKLGFIPKDIVEHNIFLKKMRMYEVDNIKGIRIPYFIKFTSKKQPDKLRMISFIKLGSFPLFFKKV